MNNVRALAALVIDDVIARKQSLDSVLEKYACKLPDPRDQGLLQEICYGTLRMYYRLAALAALLLAKPLKTSAHLAHALLLVGIYQLQYMRIPEHAAVAETVEAARELNNQWAVSLLNGVLRTFLRQKEMLINKLDQNQNQEIIYSHPSWLIDEIKKAWPQNWQEILLANNQRPPLTLRVNTSLISREEYLNVLKINNIEATLCPFAKAAITITKPLAAQELPGFAQGYFSVQDIASQQVVPLLELAPQMRVLDACAAPGGKLTHILESEPNLAQVIALEANKNRMQKITDNLHRLNLKATLVHGKAEQPKAWWDGQKFERILLDAPCSATGVIRRHPDIKFLKSGQDIAQLAKKQLEMLNALWPLLTSGGTLTYVTCSILAQENDDNLKKFKTNHPDAHIKSIHVPHTLATTYGKQALPGNQGMDGFYYACLEKNTKI
jgi:16S rRNA (cytosine967-C5)-methyltransferase